MKPYWKAKDIMTPEPITISMFKNVGELISLFHHHHISGAPVKDNEGNLVGMVSLRDIAFTGMKRVGQISDESLSGYRVHGKTQRGREPETCEWDLNPDLTIADIMTPAIFSVEADTPVSEVAETMLRGKIHRLVVTQKGSVVGIVTSHDLLKVVSESKEQPVKQ